ncbi:FG-GAP-like repeat-containing protein, partial [Pyxidicoccus fallax]
LEGLASATRYTFTIQARNAVGDGPRSDAWVTSTLCGAVSLVDSGEVAVGDSPGEVATADFNGDGKADLAVSNGQDASVSVLLGQGDGHFQAARRVPVGNVPRDVSAADFNRDGKVDLAVLNTQDASVSVLLGRGDGTFGTQRTFPTGTSPQVMTTQDFTGDGVLDLFTANSSIPLRSYTATLLRGDGTGAFTSTNYQTGFVAHGLTGADVDTDGKLDLVLAHYYDGVLNLYQSVGDGTFSTVTRVSPLTYPNHVRATDLDSDGRVDLVVTDQFSVITYRGQAAGGFVRKDDLALRSIARALALTDLDGDGRQDVVVSSGVAQVVSVFQGASTGGFS